MPTTKFADLPVAPAGTAWDKGEANQNVQKWAGGDDLDMAKYSKAFFWVAENPPEKIGTPVCTSAHMKKMWPFWICVKCRP